MANPRESLGGKTLPAEYYTSADVYRRESERIFDSSWLCVARSLDVPHPGDRCVVEVEGESLILLRDGDSRLRCFFNVCRHRGTRLCTAGEEQSGKVVRCAYHGWAYDLTGRLVNAPNMSDAAGFDKEDYPLQSVSTTEWEGFVFVSLAADPVELESAFAPVFERFREWSLQQLVRVDQRVYDVRANWKLLFQNYSECYHCSRVHPQLNALSSYQTAANDRVAGAFLGGPMELADGVTSMTTTGAACGQRLPKLREQDRRRVYYYTLFPTMFISPHPDFVLVHRLERLAVDRTRVVCEFLFHPDEPNRAGFDAGPAVDFWDETNRQDWHVCELSQQGVASRSYVPGPYSNLECTLVEFDRHYLRTLGT